MKTIEEIARETFGAMHSQAAEACENEILAHIESAIETDRAQRAADIATLAAAAANYAEHILDNIESMREDDEDRITDQAERDEIIAAINRLTGTKEA